MVLAFEKNASGSVKNRVFCVDFSLADEIPEIIQDIIRNNYKNDNNGAKYNNRPLSGRGVAPDYLDCGIRVINPLQVMAGIDIRELKKQYGQNLAWYGNIDAHMFGKDVNNIISEVDSRIKCFPNGGFIAHSDHSVPPTMSLKDFQYLSELVKKQYYS